MLYNRYQAAQKSKKSNQKVGVRSIYDIINNPDKSDGWKISYIRHHYVYYEGNYDLFHDKAGKPNENKRLLDSIIFGIIHKTIDPQELSKINKEITKLRKAKNFEIEALKQKELDGYIQKKKATAELEQNLPQTIILPKEDYAYKKGIDEATAKPYFELIDKYLDTLPPEEKERALTWKYTDLKKVAKWWNKSMLKELPTYKPSEIIEQRNGTEALLKGYKKYIKTEWKNNSNEA